MLTANDKDQKNTAGEIAHPAAAAVAVSVVAGSVPVSGENEVISSTIDEYLNSKVLSEYEENNIFINYRNEPLTLMLMKMPSPQTQTDTDDANPNGPPNPNPDGLNPKPNPPPKQNPEYWGGGAANSPFSAFSLLHCESCHPTLLPSNLSSTTIPPGPCTCKPIFNAENVSNCQSCRAPRGIQW